MDPFAASALRSAYDTVALDYVSQFGDDLASLPLDRAMLDRALAAADGNGWIVEAGCGPAPAAEYFSGRASPVVGLDLSAAMLRVAAARNPGLACASGDLRRLPFRNRSCRLVILFYVLHHLGRAQLAAALAEVHRVLHDEGIVAVATHLGEGDVVIDEFLGHRIDPIAGSLFTRDAFVDALTQAGFRVEVERQRDALPHEYPSRRIYLIATMRSASEAGRV